MKLRIYKHWLFWFAITIQGVFLQYTWLPERVITQAHESLIWLALRAHLPLLPVKMLFTYYILFTIKKAFLQKGSISSLTIKIIFSLLIAVVSQRLVSLYLIQPYIYPTRPLTIGDLFDPSLTLFAAVDLGYVAGIAVAIGLFYMQLLKISNEKELIKEKLETELKFLKNQINPHFLFNTLNNIYGLSRKKSDKTPNVVLKLSKLLRFMLYESGKNCIAISKEIKILEDYVELEKIRYDDRLEICFKTEIDNFRHPITPLILLPFIENAFKHGINETTGQSHIDINILLKNGWLDFKITNTQNNQNGDKINEQIGLSNVKRQLELTYSEFSLNIDNLPDTFSVDLQLNLNTNATFQLYNNRR